MNTAQLKKQADEIQERGAAESATAQMLDDLINDYGLFAVVDAIAQIGESRKEAN